MKLSEIKTGQTVKIISVGGKGTLRQHFLDMGVIPGANVTLVQFAPMGDPMDLLIHGYELTLRLADAEQIEVEPVKPSELFRKKGISFVEKSEHPGLGEDGKYHVKGSGNPVPKGTLLTFALAGNQNCGKTTLFNQLTGSNQHVGNFPGVTVDRKDGAIRGYPNTEVTDLPGIYSLSPYTSEELVSRRFILEQKPTGIINIVDATNIERNLYLTLQLMELEIPIVLALNMMDEVRGNGGTVDINKMEEMLGIPVVPISAAKNEGVDELIRHAVHIAQYRERPGRTDFCNENVRGGAVHRALHGIMELISDHAKSAEIPLRFAATKVIEGDEMITGALKLSANEKEMIEHIVFQMEKEGGLDRAAAVADMRFSFITRLCSRCVVKPAESKEHRRSRRIDKILTGKYTAIPAFVGIMALVFYLTFNVFGAALQNLLQTGIDSFSGFVDRFLTDIGVNELLHSLIIDGIFGGIGSILSFIPIILILFLFLSLLEDSGYMARIAFVTDKLLRKIGLSGRSIVPLLIGFGCTVPGVMASRTMPSQRDRRLTVMLIPFMSCTAKLPIYGLLTQAFFPEHSGLIMVGIYFLGIITAIIVASIMKRTAFKGEAVPFVMELPNYRMPRLRNVLQLIWDKAKDFLQRAFTVIFIASVIIWFLQSFDFRLNPVLGRQEESMLSSIAGYIAPIFAPLGFNDWRICTSLIAGFMAKESVASTLSVLLSGASITTLLTPRAAVSFLVFCLLYTPCVAAIASIRRELGGKWAGGVVIGQCAVAYLLAFAARLVGMFLGVS